MNAQHGRPWVAALLLGAASAVFSPAAQAGCGCPAGKEVLTLAQSTQADKCGLEIVLHAIEKKTLSADVYHIYVKSKLIAASPTSAPFEEKNIPQGGAAVNIPITPKPPSLTCTTLVIAGQHGPQNGLVQFQWTYF